MKFMLTEKDHLERHHIYSLIVKYMHDHHGESPNYVIAHPATYHKIIMLTNERNDDFTYPVIHFDYSRTDQTTTIYGVSFIRSKDVEEGFVIIT